MHGFLQAFDELLHGSGDHADLISSALQALVNLDGEISLRNLHQLILHADDAVRDPPAIDKGNYSCQN